MILLKYFIFGFFIKVITGFDDTITHIPIIASVTKTRVGKMAFSFGMLLAIVIAIFIALFFSTLFREFNYYRYIVVILIFGLALAIYFDLFVHKPKGKAESKLLELQKITSERFMQLLGIGFIASIATVLDDIIAYSALFFENFYSSISAILGILAATVLEIILVIYFSEKISKIKYKEEIASIGLIIIGILIWIGIL